MQISSLTKENVILAAKHWANDCNVGDSICENKLSKERDSIDIDSTGETPIVKTYGETPIVETYLELETRSLYEQVKVPFLFSQFTFSLLKEMQLLSAYKNFLFL